MRSTIPAGLAMMALALVVVATGRAEAQDRPAGGDAEALAKQLANPVASVVSVPFQFNWDGGVGPEDGTRFLLNVQPVVPFELGPRWTLIGRFIVPVLAQPPLVAGGDGSFGTGDIVTSMFFSPQPNRIVWGVGPVFALPTTDDPLLGSGKWSAGPTVVLLKQSGPWTYGLLGNHLWSFADASDAVRADVDQTMLQPFLAYVTPKGMSYALQSEATANWEARSGEVWTVPIYAGVAKLTRFGPFPFQVGGGVAYYVEQPQGGPEWKLRLAFTLMLPRGK